MAVEKRWNATLNLIYPSEHKLIVHPLTKISYVLSRRSNCNWVALYSGRLQMRGIMSSYEDYVAVFFDCS